jgi:hypothetical protein
MGRSPGERYTIQSKTCILRGSLISAQWIAELVPVVKCIDPTSHGAGSFAKFLLGRDSDNVIPELTYKKIMRGSEGFHEAS